MLEFIRRECGKLWAIGELELDLPLNVLSRSAGRHAVDLLLEHGAGKLQMHAFDGKYGAAVPAVEAGFFFSVPQRFEKAYSPFFNRSNVC